MRGKGRNGGGRQKGTPNKSTVEVRERIERMWDPIGFLGSVVAGGLINGEAPTLAQRIDSAKKLADKILPDLRGVDVSGTMSLDLGVMIDAAWARAEGARKK